MARMMLPFLTKQLQPFNVKGFPPLVLSQSRTAAAVAVVPASYSDGAYFGTGVPSYSGNTVTIAATHAGGTNNVACIFLHYSGGLIISGITFDGVPASIVTVSFATSVQGVVAYAPCSSSGSHSWAVTFTTTPSAGSVQGTTVTMTGVTSTPSQTAVQAWGTYNPETTGSITVTAGGIAMTFLASASTGGTWSGATEITTASASFPLAYSSSSATVSYAVAGSGSQMATLSWDAAATVTINVNPSTGHLVITGYQPTVTLGVNLAPSTGHLTIGGKIPTVTVTFNVSPSTGHLTIGGKVPSVFFGTSVNPSTGHLTLGGHTPSVTLATNVSPSTGHLSIGGKVATVSQTINVSPSTGHLGLSGKTPSVTLAANIAPSTGHLLLTGYTPTVDNGGAVGATALPIKVIYRRRGQNR